MLLLQWQGSCLEGHTEMIVIIDDKQHEIVAWNQSGYGDINEIDGNMMKYIIWQHTARRIIANLVDAMWLTSMIILGCLESIVAHACPLYVVIIVQDLLHRVYGNMAEQVYSSHNN